MLMRQSPKMKRALLSNFPLRNAACFSRLLPMQNAGEPFGPPGVFGECWCAVLDEEAKKPQSYKWPGMKLKDGSVADY